MIFLWMSFGLAGRFLEIDWSYGRLVGYIFPDGLFFGCRLAQLVDF